MRMRRIFVAIGVLALAASGASRADEIAWTPPGALRFVVVDRDMQPIRGVPVTAVAAVASGEAPGTVTFTDGRGRAGFASVPPGEYVIRFDLSGFAPTSIGPVSVRSSARDNPSLPEFLVVLNPVLWSCGVAGD